MPYPVFFTYNMVGAALWGGGVTSAGYLLGRRIPNLDHYITYIVIGIVVLSIVPVVIHLMRSKPGSNNG